MTEGIKARTLLELDQSKAQDWDRSGLVHGLMLGELYRQLQEVLDREDQELRELQQAKGEHPDGFCLDYFSRSYTMDETIPEFAIKDRPFGRLGHATKLGDLRYRWIAVFAVTGGSEGHYVHVDLLWQKEWQEGRVSLFLAKTFGGHETAVRIAGVLARVLGV